MLDSFRLFSKKKLSIVIYTVTCAFIFLAFDTYKSNVCVHFRALRRSNSSNFSQLRIQGLKLKPAEELLGIFETPDSGKKFDSRVRDFFRKNQCKLQIFMTWISAAGSFRDREFVGLETLFQTNPTACLIILSKTLDSRQGHKVLNPLIKRRFRVEPINPDLTELLKDTPAECWLTEIKAGIRDPGVIPLAQNLSNLIRLAALYKYGGVYLDTDFIILNNISALRNSIGAQSVDTNGNWTRLNNAVLIFDKNHALLRKFLQEFALTFDGNIWGHNGPYLVSRVVSKTLRSEGISFTILPPMAFYPVDWKRVEGYFTRTNDQRGQKWMESKVRQLRGASYGVHLWNRQSRMLKIEEGSVVGRLMSDYCLICSRNAGSVS